MNIQGNGYFSPRRTTRLLGRGTATVLFTVSFFSAAFESTTLVSGSLVGATGASFQNISPENNLHGPGVFADAYSPTAEMRKDVISETNPYNRLYRIYKEPQLSVSKHALALGFLLAAAAAVAFSALKCFYQLKQREISRQRASSTNDDTSCSARISEPIEIANNLEGEDVATEVLKNLGIQMHNIPDKAAAVRWRNMLFIAEFKTDAATSVGAHKDHCLLAFMKYDKRAFTDLFKIGLEERAASGTKLEFEHTSDDKKSYIVVTLQLTETKPEEERPQSSSESSTRSPSEVPRSRERHSVGGASEQESTDESVTETAAEQT